MTMTIESMIALMVLHAIIMSYVAICFVIPWQRRSIRREALESRLRILEHKRDKMAAYGEELGEVWAEIEAIEHELKARAK
jgi:hypothetical protein